jgi:hypothetical protein
MFYAKNLFWGLVVGWSLLGLSVLSFAQQSPSSKTDNPQTSVSDSDLRAFVKAYVENQKIRQKYEPTLLNTPDPEKSKPIQDQANAELKKALAKQNLTIEKYNRIYTMLNNDEQLRSKALKMIEEERKQSA